MMLLTLGDLRTMILERVDASCAYERSIIRSLRLSGAAGRIRRAACHDALRPDADIRVDDECYYVEIKSSPRAQMGGGSVAYSDVDQVFRSTGANPDLSLLIATTLNDLNDSSLRRGLRTLMQHLSRSSARPIDSVPMSGFTAQAWEDARDFGLLQAINRTFEGDTSIIADHYARKGTHYVQIAGAGFFRLGEADPARLRVPVLTGRVQVEVRLAKSGDDGRGTSKAGMRAQARLLAVGSSPFTLDDPESVERMLRARKR